MINLNLNYIFFSHPLLLYSPVVDIKIRHNNTMEAYFLYKKEVMYFLKNLSVILPYF